MLTPIDQSGPRRAKPAIRTAAAILMAGVVGVMAIGGSVEAGNANAGRGTLTGVRWTDTPGGVRWTDTPGGVRWTDTPGGVRWTDTPGGVRWTDTPGGVRWTENPNGVGRT